MRITRTQLDHLIQEEVNEILGFGKSAPSKEYPASELATLMKGCPMRPKCREPNSPRLSAQQLWGELTGVLKDQGFVVKENERLFTGEEDVVVTHQNAPKLKVFLDTVAQKNPKVFKQLLGLFNRSALDISAVVKNIIPSITTVADPEPDGDKAAQDAAPSAGAPDEEEIPPPGSDELSSSVATLSSPEDLKATIKTEPVAAPDEDEEDSKWDAAT